MICVTFIEPDTLEWKASKAASQQATDGLVAAVAAGSPIKISDLYKDRRLKDVLFANIHGKCACCDVKFSDSQQGDVDHHRRKGAIVDEHDQPVNVEDHNGDPVNHPGYYWLAYTWMNLLPSCSACNRPSRNVLGKLVGKGTRFPVSGTRATVPGEEELEQPLFLHPLFDPIADEFVLDPVTGIIAGMTD
jgi:hypothetical protein